jgi:hypothetical protein
VPEAAVMYACREMKEDRPSEGEGINQERTNGRIDMWDVGG